MQKILLWLIRKYQATNTPLHDRCRFTPTCSEYMALSLQKYGVCKGVIKGLGRIFRCHVPNGGEDWP